MNSVRTVSRKTQGRKMKKKKVMLEGNNSPFMPDILLEYCLVSQGHAHPPITPTPTLDSKGITPITCTQLVLTQASPLEQQREKGKNDGLPHLTCGLSTAERTGSPVFHTLWSYVLDILARKVHMLQFSL